MADAFDGRAVNSTVSLLCTDPEVVSISAYPAASEATTGTPTEAHAVRGGGSMLSRGAAAKNGAIDRIIYLPLLSRLLVCESDRGATLWESHCAMRLVARLPHGTQAEEMLLGAAAGSSTAYARAAGAARAAAARRHGGATAEPPAAGSSRTSTVLDACHAAEAARLVTSGVDRRVVLWDERAPHAPMMRWRAPCEQLCVAWDACQRVLYSGGMDGRVLMWADVPTSMGAAGGGATPACGAGVGEVRPRAQHDVPRARDHARERRWHADGRRGALPHV